MSIEVKLNSLKTKLEGLERERQKQVGKREQLLEQLKGQGVDSYEDGLSKESELKAKKEEAEAAGTALAEEIESKYGGYL